MRAVWLERFGPPEALRAGDAPEPEVGRGQAIVDVAFAGVTFADTMFRAGAPGPFTGAPPLIPGNGVGGVLVSVGPSVHRGLVGTRVVSATGGAGGYAERVAVDAADVVEVPGRRGPRRGRRPDRAGGVRAPRPRWPDAERAADAHAAIESRATIGKTLLVVAAPI